MNDMELPGMNAETLADFRAKIEAKLECEFRKRDVINSEIADLEDTLKIIDKIIDENEEVSI